MTPLSSEELQKELDLSPLIKFMNISVQSWQPEENRLALVMPYRHELGGGADVGHIHGGAIGALIDSATAMIVYAKGVKNAPTINYRVDCIRPIVNSGMRVDTHIRRLGRTVALIDADVFDDNNKLCAVGRATLAVRD